jgi:hypothetical protein
MSAQDITLKGKLGSVAALSPYSLQDPAPSGDGCTISSIYHPQWSFSAFEVDETVTTGASAVSFNLILQTGNPGFQFPIAISQDTPVAGSSSWYHCAIGPDGENALPLWPTDCTFKYDKATKQLSLNANWACNDLDLAHP